MANSNSTVAHAWAHNLDKAHNGSHMSHHNGRLMSYGTCIAQRISLNGKVCYLWNGARHSSSTCKHQGYALSAIPSRATVFYCYFENWGNDELVWASDRTSRIRFGMRYILKELETCIDMTTARKLNSRFTYKGYEQLQRWLEFTKDTTIPKLLRLSEEEFVRYIPGINATYYSRRTKNSGVTPAIIKKFLKMLHEHKGFEEICDAINGRGTYAEWDKYQQRILKANETRRRTEEVREIKQKEARTFAEKVIQERGDEGRRWLWHEGYSISVGNQSQSFYYGGNVLLRHKNGSKCVETSKGIRIPIEECRRLWDIISRWHAAGLVFDNGNTSVKATMGSFTISRFRNDILIAGCHAIAYKEMEDMARQLGFISA